MPSRGKRRSWILIPIRALVVTFLFTLLSFALGLLLGIIGILIHSAIIGVHPNLTIAYRHVALPLATIIAPTTLICVMTMEIRRYWQTKVLDSIENLS